MSGLNYTREECFCFNAQKMSRAITRLYDKYLKPAGITPNQFIVISTLVSSGGVYKGQIKDLCESLVMDRSTLTRAFFYLKKIGIVSIEHFLVKDSEYDGRSPYVYSLTSNGEAIFQKALPLWKQANDALMEIVGKERYQSYIGEVDFILEVVKKMQSIDEEAE